MGNFSERAHRLKTGETVTVRSACPNDASAVLTHGRAVIDESEFVVTCPEEFNFTEEQERDRIYRHVNEPGNVFLVAEASRQIIGVLFIESVQRQRLAHLYGDRHIFSLAGAPGEGVHVTLAIPFSSYDRPAAD